ncbi:hypothetical protein ES711_01670 [Gelidibacter salicanalis]|uniref:Uncharacterized protein n=1 Tax=Gelidibacter salicanalis TaxID=291193 RepID=A0A5C7AQM6_9FLAO|nr:hypothetical protein [Gelidibacter salicanalis]TXE10641.1 hypothetical protein ES711_01670 [Gelidibacter salicanalis]
MQKKLIAVCLINFLIAALMGLALRYIFVQPLGINFRYLTHAHSHVAMLGWVYLMLYLLIVHYFIPEKKPIYNRLFWVTQFAVVGMMVSFPFTGYAAISITFSCLHIFCSYYFVRLVWKNHQVSSPPIRMLLKSSLVFMLLSTIGVWCLGPAVAILGQASAFYQIAIQFFLHFQFNGWFMLAVLAVFLHQFPIDGSALFKRFFNTLIAATILTFALPVSWFLFHPLWLLVNAIGVVLQLFSGYYFLQLLKPHWTTFWSGISTLTKALYGLALISFILKIVLQTASIIPLVAQMAHQYRNFVIGFIHLMMLGVISGFLFAFLLQKYPKTNTNKSLSFGIYTFILGFVSTEILLILQGIYYFFGWGMLPQYYLILLLCSIFLPLGILFFILNLRNYDTKTLKTT